MARSIASMIFVLVWCAAWRVDLGGAMEVTSFSPPWLAGHPPVKSLESVEVWRPHEVVTDAPLAESMLRALYRGEQPRFASSDVGVSLSAVSFRPRFVCALRSTVAAGVIRREHKNRLLSEHRAKAVTDYLVAAGCSSESIESRFHGSRFPIASNQTELGRLQNRRVTVRLERSTAKVAKR